ncbi:STAS domain-containing protein [Janibacter sp. G1551]|uniref:STAS domain-containing protein n=1 Tax=Janibacter sp. G1551 TaxID=3420440 RepID=UPI003D038974
MVPERLVDGWAVLAPVGALDLLGGERLVNRVQELCAEDCPRIVLDLGSVTSTDASGAGSLIKALRHTRGAGGDFRLACAPREIRGALHVRQIDRIFALHDTVVEAIVAGTPATRRLMPRQRSRAADRSGE